MNKKLGLYRVKDQYTQNYHYKLTFITKIVGEYVDEMCLYSNGVFYSDSFSIKDEYFKNRLEYIGPYMTIEEALEHCPEEFL